MAATRWRSSRLEGEGVVLCGWLAFLCFNWHAVTVVEKPAIVDETVGGAMEGRRPWRELDMRDDVDAGGCMKIS